MNVKTKWQSMRMLLAGLAVAGLMAGGLPVNVSEATAGPFRLELVIDGVSLAEMMRWRADDPLDAERLRWRLERLRKFAGFPLLKKAHRRHAQALIAAYEKRLQAMQASPAERRARHLLARHEGNVRGLPAAELRRIEGRITRLLAAPGLRPGTRERLLALRRAIHAERRRQTTDDRHRRVQRARALWSRAAMPETLSGRELRQIRREAVTLLAEPALPPHWQERLEALVVRLDEELAVRRARHGERRQRARALLAEQGRLDTMNLPRLRQLHREVKNLQAGPGLPPRLRQRLARLQAAVEEEIRARIRDRQAAREEARRLLLRGERLDRLDLRSLRAMRVQIRQLREGRDLPPRLQQRLAALEQAVHAELRARGAARLSPAERRARQVLRQARRPDRHDDRTLDRLWRATLDLLATPGIEPQTRRRLAELRQTLRQERSRRAARRAARRLLADRRPARSLSDAELRRRLAETRRVLRERALPARERERLRRRLAADRREWRHRIAIAEGLAVAGEAARQQADAILRDDRPSSLLRTPALKARIRAIRTVLAKGFLPADRRRLLRQRLAEDRAELRRRLIEARRKRQARLLREGGLALGVRAAERRTITAAEARREEIARQLAAAPRYRVARRFGIEELRRRPELREIMPAVELDSIHFAFDSAEIPVEEIDTLERIGETIERIIASHPNEVFLIEGHTDAVGRAEYNQRLSERRAEAVKRALTEFFYIPAENLVTVGYGERFLKIPTPYAEPENRRVTIRRITPLLER